MIPTIPLRVVKVVDVVENWEIRVVEGEDVVLVKKGESKGPWECDARDFFEALLSVRSEANFVEFVRNFRDPGVNEREYLGTQEFKTPGRPITFKNYVVRPQPKVFLSQIHDFQRVLKRAINSPVDSWQFHHWFDPKDISIELELENGRLQGVCRFHSGASACLAVIYLEKVAGRVKYGWCCLCGKLFRKTSRHKRKYCTNICAHRASMRMLRDREGKIQRAAPTRRRVKPRTVGEVETGSTGGKSVI
jgi:hypothetical protein